MNFAIGFYTIVYSLLNTRTKSTTNNLFRRREQALPARKLSVLLTCATENSGKHKAQKKDNPENIENTHSLLSCFEGGNQ